MSEITDAAPSSTVQSDYSAFLLRCWRNDGAWRFSLEDVATRQRHVVVGSQAVVALLMERLTESVTNEDGKVS